MARGGGLLRRGSRSALIAASYGFRARHMARGHFSSARQGAASGRSAFYERIWGEAAAELGAEVHRLGAGVLEIGLEDGPVRVAQAYTPLDDPVTLRVAGDKALVHRLLAEAGVAVPEHVEFTLASIDEAYAFLDRVGGSCVVKPARNTGGGKGVATGIRNRRTLRWAAAAAAGHGTSMLIERQTTGINFRLLFLDGRLLDAVERRPPTIVGDGSSTVRQLVDAVNTERLAGDTHGHALLTSDLDVRRTLEGQGLSLGSVPGAGVRVALKTAINENSAADNITATDRICADVVREAAKAVEVVGARLCGVDVLTPDPGLPLREAGGVILEVNTTPGFFFHYGKGDGTTVPVALHALKAIAGMRAARGPAGPDPVAVAADA